MSLGDGQICDFGKDMEFAACFLTRLITLPFAVKAVVVLGVPDVLEEAGPDAKLTAEEIASRLATPNADGSTLDRLLRMLASQKLVMEFISKSPKDPNVVERRFGTTPVLSCLASSCAGGFMATSVQLLTSPHFLASMQFMHAPVLNPKSPEPFVLAHGKGLFEFLETDPELQKMFDTVMGSGTNKVLPQVLETYKGFEGLSSLVDVGGGIGANLSQILPKYPNLRGINYDQPHVVAKGLQVPRLEHVGGNFFESVPEGDAVWMKWILHDWSDEDCVKILKVIHVALPPQGKVINMDALVPEVSNSSLRTQGCLSSDVLMMTYCRGGKERTLTQFQKIAADAGFPRVEVKLNVGSFCVLEFYKS